MTRTDLDVRLLNRLGALRRLCHEMQLGQLMATLGLLGEDATGRSLWDIEDDELADALERFSDDLMRRAST
jgi:hypothetical protein